MWCFLACDPTQQSGAHTTNQPSSWTPQSQQRKLHKTASILAGPTASTKASTQSSIQRCMRGILASNLTRATRRYRMPGRVQALVRDTTAASRLPHEHPSSKQTQFKN